MGSNQFSDATILEIADRRARGESLPRLCHEYDVSRSTICRRFKKLGISISCKFSNEVIAEIASAYTTGETTFSLAKRYGVDHHTISHYLRRVGQRVRTTEENRVLNGDPRINELYSSYRRTAQQKNLSFSLTRDEFMRLIGLNCYYCGQEPSNTQRHWRSRSETPIFFYTGIDRIDSNAGYITSNVVSCCFTCNSAKGAKPLTEFRSWINRLVTQDAIGAIDLLLED
jgi:5-methylcytosine-specific restriction endonuclease McrA